MAKKQTVDDLLAGIKSNWPEAFSPIAELMMRVFRLNNLVIENARRTTAKSGLTFTELEILLALRASGFPYELTPTALYSAVLMSSGGLTKVLGVLTRRGLIKRIPDRTDRRSLRVRLTAAGRRRAETVMADVLVSDSKLLLGALSSEEMGLLIALLRKLLNAIEPSGSGRNSATSRENDSDDRLAGRDPVKGARCR